MRLRIRFSKVGRVRFISHRDVARAWERALRRAQLPVVYTGGFSPRPQLAFGLALPTGCESVAEYLDVTVADPTSAGGGGPGEPGSYGTGPDGVGTTPSALVRTDPATLAACVNPSLPAGMAVLGAVVVPDGVGSLQEEVTSCTWEIEVPGVPPGALDEALGRAMAAAALPIKRERKGRVEDDDLRPSLLALSSITPHDAGSRFAAELATRPRGVRPAELARALGLVFGRVVRTGQWIERDGSRIEPLAAHVAEPAAAGSAL